MVQKAFYIFFTGIRNGICFRIYILSAIAFIGKDFIKPLPDFWQHIHKSFKIALRTIPY